MAPPRMFKNKEEILAMLLRFYRAHTTTCSGPAEAVGRLWRRLHRRIPAKLMEELAQNHLAHELSRRATGAVGTGGGWRATHGMVTITIRDATDPAARGEAVQVPITRKAYAGPKKIYPLILERTIYATATVSKKLIDFTLGDFDHCIATFAEQRDGLDRRMEAMAVGKGLLMQHKETSVKDLPQDALDAFAKEWQAALHPPKASAA